MGAILAFVAFIVAPGATMGGAQVFYSTPWPTCVSATDKNCFEPEKPSQVATR
jgi:hypothetical protein